jgi:hypothetical protein
MDNQTLTILCSFIISVLGVFTTAKLTNFRLSQLEKSMSLLPEILSRLTKLETYIDCTKNNKDNIQ